MSASRLPIEVIDSALKAPHAFLLLWWIIQQSINIFLKYVRRGVLLHILSTWKYSKYKSFWPILQLLPDTGSNTHTHTHQSLSSALGSNKMYDNNCVSFHCPLKVLSYSKWNNLWANMKSWTTKNRPYPLRAQREFVIHTLLGNYRKLSCFSFCFFAKLH